MLPEVTFLALAVPLNLAKGCWERSCGSQPAGWHRSAMSAIPRTILLDESHLPVREPARLFASITRQQVYHLASRHSASRAQRACPFAQGFLAGSKWSGLRIGIRCVELVTP